jgi:hypothetical protein
MKTILEWLNRDRLKQTTWRGGERYSFNLYKGLFDMVQELPLGRMVEVGCHKGESTELFALHFDRVFAVDPWGDYKTSFGSPMTSKGVEDSFDKLVEQYSNITKIKETSIQASLHFVDGDLDFVYIDGAHDYESVRNDIASWLPKICKGGVIGGHDYQNIKAVRKAVNDVFGKPDQTFCDWSWLCKL